jgi:voltage-gated potassium channel
MVASEIYAQLSTPLLWRFLQDMPARGNEWAADIVDRLQRHCGPHLGSVWKITLSRRRHRRCGRRYGPTTPGSVI